jgi:hypothetical protein
MHLKHIPLTKIPHLVSGMVAGGMALAIAGTALFPLVATEAKAPPLDPIHAKIRERARRSETSTARAGRDYYRALDIYNRLFLTGREDLTKPERNDRESIHFYLNGLYETARRRASTSSSGTAEVTFDDLDFREQDRMRFYLHTRYCPEGLEQTSPGFYELCRELLGRRQRKTAPQGLTNQYQQAAEERLQRRTPTNAQ